MVDKKHKLLVQYKDYDGTIRARILMGIEGGRLCSLGGSLLMPREQFQVVQEVLQEGAKKQDNFTLEYEELKEGDSFDPITQETTETAPKEGSS